MATRGQREPVCWYAIAQITPNTPANNRNTRFTDELGMIEKAGPTRYFNMIRTYAGRGQKPDFFVDT